MKRDAGRRAADEFLERGNKALVDGSLECAEQAYGRALDLYESAGERGRAADVVCNLATICWKRNDLREADRLYNKARDQYAAIGSYYAVALVEQYLGNVAYSRNDLHRARWHYYRALPGIEEVDSIRAADCRVNIAALLTALGQCGVALRHLSVAEDSYRRQLSGDDLLVKLAEADENAGFVLKALERYPEARVRLTRSRATYERLGMAVKLAPLDHNLAELARLSGRPVEAAELYRRAMGNYLATQRDHEIADSLLGLGIMALDEGDLSVARRKFRAAAVLYRQTGQWLALAQTFHNLGVSWRDDPKRALSYVVPAWAVMRSMSWGLPEVAARAEWRTATEQAARIALELAAAAGDSALLAELIESMRGTTLRPGLELPQGITSLDSAASEMPSVTPPTIDCGWPARLSAYLEDAEELRAVGGDSPRRLRNGSAALGRLLTEHGRTG